MMRQLSTLLAATAIFACVATGCEKRPGSCRDVGVAGRCFEYAGGLDVQQQSCLAKGAAWLDGKCPREGALGACKGPVPAGRGMRLEWHYRGGGLATAAEVKQACASSSAEFVAP